ncbi:hypothetical protein Y032_0202g1798 [Ancylostoma ceylanicum]|uniref:Reverse transcriptase domain-containing protein n=1 Tax=Ancylostoma ceylanicum TaxID=53326 RepID=A0A016SME4_9BILA|nr:hypothetical protein Y032_0202g1798 [Ancylostoma ceylanicum]
MLLTYAKVLPHEAVATQHRPLICTMKIMPPKGMHDERPARIKWWRLKEKEESNATQAIVEVARSELGTTKPGRRKIDRQTWPWTDEVKIKVREKKRLYHIFFGDKTVDNWRQYLIAKKAAKKAVAVTKAAHYDNISKHLGAKDGGERLIYRLARSRQRQTEDVEKFYGVNDEHGQLITDRKEATERWCDYFEKISTEEFSHPPIPRLPPRCGPIQPITMEETMAALNRMKPGKARCPDDVAAELWMSRHWSSAQWLTAFFNKVVEEKKTPVDWKRSNAISIWKRKGNPADCANYRPIRLLSHSMKIFERGLSMTGVLRDKNIPDRFKSEVCRAVVRSVALCGAEFWLATKEVERRLV